MQLVIGAGRTAAIQSRFRPVTTATTPSRRRPWASRARQPGGPGVERPIGQGAVAVHGRDGVRVVPARPGRVMTLPEQPRTSRT
jgi:hypothetical protein